MAYIGREPQIGNYQVCDAISVVNAQAAYTMQVSSADVIPESVNHMIVSLNGVIQNPGGASPSYTISNATITFSRNLVTGETIDFIYLLGNVLDLGTPSDDTVTGAKIVDDAINSEHYTNASIDLAHMSANSIDSDQYVNGSIDHVHLAGDAVDGDNLADDAVDSEHYTDGSIDTAHLADGQVTTAKLATAVFTAATDIGAAIVDADLFLMDDGAGGTIRKTTAARLKTYAGETNKPIFKTSGNNQTIAHNTDTKMVIAAEAIDTGGCYDLASSKRFVPDVAGKYFFILSLFCPTGDDINYFNASVRKNNSAAGGFSGVQRNYNNVCFNGIIDADGDDDYFEPFCEQESGSNRTIKVTEFSAFFIGN